MKSVKELVSPYKGSEATYEMVKEQIAERWGEDAAEDFDPTRDAMPFACWLNYGFRVKRGEKALKSITFIEAKDEDGKVEKKIRRTISLFHRRQVEKDA